MEEIQLTGYVDNSGLFIKPEFLKEFINSNVKVTISGINKFHNNTNFMKFAGILSDSDASILNEGINECRKIDFETW